MEFEVGRFRVVYSPGDGTEDGMWIYDEGGEGIRVTEQDLADYFEDNF